MINVETRFLGLFKVLNSEPTKLSLIGNRVFVVEERTHIEHTNVMATDVVIASENKGLLQIEHLPIADDGSDIFSPVPIEYRRSGDPFKTGIIKRVSVKLS